MTTNELDIRACETAMEPEVTFAEDVLKAIDLASDQDTTTWLVSDGKTIAAIVPVDVAETAEQAIWIVAGSGSGRDKGVRVAAIVPVDAAEFATRRPWQPPAELPAALRQRIDAWRKRVIDANDATQRILREGPLS